MNRLATEKSPYLRQHRDNPVAWFPWGEAAFAEAQRENKPIFLSIGYSTCYWCHVMERDSFEQEDVARVLNEHFVSIKVDREERPDLDQIYMDAVVTITGHGGWPMSVFLTPDRKPFFGGTFFPRPQFINLLERIHEVWARSPEDIRRSSEQLLGLLGPAEAPIEQQAEFEPLLTTAVESFGRSFDPHWGGFGQAPKFPPALGLSFLLRYWRRSGSLSALQMVTRTLEQMARGGIYDHLGGGFHRYSTDPQWLVPHFEKMLYDNALLARAYLEAYQATDEPLFLNVAEETLAYLSREMRASDGGFFSAQDAGEVGREGAHYVWSAAELRTLLPSEDYDRFCDVYAVTDHGNFEGQHNVLSLSPRHAWAVKSENWLQSAQQNLLRSRSKRPAPERDEKILTAWNALAISAFARAYQVARRENALQQAQACASFVLDVLFVGGKLRRRYCDGEAAIPAFLEDYSYLVAALLDLYESNFDERWFTKALELQHLQDDLFWDARAGGYHFASAEDASLIRRKKDYNDGATPSGNGVAVLNLLRLFHLTGEERYRSRADELARLMLPLARRFPNAEASLMIALDFRTDLTSELVLTPRTAVPELREALFTIQREFLPNKVLAAGPSALVPLAREKNPFENQLTYYLCEQQTCTAPTTSLPAALERLRTCRPLSAGTEG